MNNEYYIIVDVGCIECGEQTELKGVYKTKKAAGNAFKKIAKELNIEDWQPRGGFLEFLGLYKKEETTYMFGTGYFTGGQHALELHVYPARKIKRTKKD